MANVKKIATAGLTLTMVIGMLPSAASAYSDKSGWVWNEETGDWYYYEDGRKLKCEVRYDTLTGKSYLLDTSGKRVTQKGWFTLDYYYTYYGDKVKQARKYYLQEDGAITSNGFQKIGKKTLYFYSGAMVTNSTVCTYDDSWKVTAYYYLGKDGTKVTKQGWHHLKGTAYDSSGRKYKQDDWIYVKKGGKLVTGLKKIGKKKYVFSNNGYMVTNGAGCDMNRNTYYLADKNGVQVTKKGWHKVTVSTTYKDSDNSSTSKSTVRYYVKKDGTLQKGLKKLKGKYYWFNPEMQICTTFRKNGDEYDTVYYFGNNGECKRTKKIYYAT